MSTEFGGIAAVAVIDLLDQLARSSQSQDSPKFDWSDYNKQVEEVAAQIAEDAQKKQQEAMTDLPPETLALTTLSSIVEGMLTVDQLPFSFDGRVYMKGLYDLVQDYPAGCRNQIWQAGRQVEKSTTQSAKSIALGVAFPAYKTLYIAPRFDQVTVFSQQRFKPMCEDSKELAGRWVDPNRTLWQVGAKQFLNGSFFNFRSCYLNADNSRGISAHHLMIDEIQDVVSDAVPILEQCQSHASRELKFNTYAGTPKTNSNVITRRFKNSCQFEWLIRCDHCNNWNYPDDNIIGATFYECLRCHKQIYPINGQWVPARPDMLDKCWGFRLPQLIAPFKTHADILATRNDPQVSKRQYYNECLGLPYDEGELVLTEKDMIEACAAGDGEPMWQASKAYSMTMPKFMGVDYGTAEGEKPSFTVITIGFFNAYGKFQVIYMEKLLGERANLAKQPAYLDQVGRRYNVTWMGTDWGFGAPLNQRLVEEYGWPRFDSTKLLLEMQYVKQKNKANWNPSAQRYMIDRSTSMSDMIDAIRTKKIIFFRYEDLKPFVNDFTTIYIEFDNNHGTMRYDHEMPDDAFHSLNYAYLAGMQYHGQLTASALPDVGLQDPEYDAY